MHHELGATTLMPNERSFATGSLTYSTEAYKRLIQDGGNYLSIFESFLMGADIFESMRDQIRAEFAAKQGGAGSHADLSDEELAFRFQEALGSMTMEEQQTMATSIKRREQQYYAQFTNPKTVKVANARNLMNHSDLLNAAGFILVPHRSVVPVAEMSNMSKSQALQYYDELMEVTKALMEPKGTVRATGPTADKKKQNMAKGNKKQAKKRKSAIYAFCDSHVIRREREGRTVGHSGNADEPLTFVHNDFTVRLRTVSNISTNSLSLYSYVSEHVQASSAEFVC